MLRLAVTPRWLAIAGVMVVLVIATILLGRWQWDRTQAILAAERASLSQPIAVQQVFPAEQSAPPSDLPDEGVGRPVTASGTFDPEQQVVVTSRELDGRPGVWIVTGLDLGDGSTVAVLRGWLAAADDPGAAIPPGRVTVSGILQPDEQFYADAANAEGSVSAISHVALARLWGAPLLPGFVVLQSQEPASPPAPEPVQPTMQAADVAFPLQNFFYAFQWWLFGVFCVVVYARWLWLESRPVTGDPQ
jgi:cytochrome oxidase assembly protein ShyY1